MGHAHPSGRFLLYQTDPTHERFIPRKSAAHILEEAAIDLVDDLQLSRNEYLEQADRPFFESLGQQRVVRVGESTERNLPRLIPRATRLIEQDPHQLSNAQCRMRVVHLYGYLLRQR